MNTKHTPGPWYVIPDPAWVGKHPLHDARFVATCDFSRIEYPLEEGMNGARPWRFENREDSIICTMPDAENQKANARLIAAAPELLEALKAIEDWILAPGSRPDPQVVAKIARNAIAKATGEPQ